MFGLGTLLSVPPLSLLGVNGKKRFKWLKHSISIPLYECFIRGMWYYDGKNYTHKIYRHDDLDLVRQPGNTYDEFAIEVYWSGIKMGYLPKYENVPIANLIDNGMLLRSQVKGVYPENELHERLRIKLELLIPDSYGFGNRVKSKRNKSSLSANI